MSKRPKYVKNLIALEHIFAHIGKQLAVVGVCSVSDNSSGVPMNGKAHRILIHIVDDKNKSNGILYLVGLLACWPAKVSFASPNLFPLLCVWLMVCVRIRLLGAVSCAMLWERHFLAANFRLGWENYHPPRSVTNRWLDIFSIRDRHNANQMT